MTRKTWPLILGSFVVSSVLIAACNSSSEDEEDTDTQTGKGGAVNSTAKGGATQATGVLQRGGSTNTQAATGRGGANIFSSIQPAQGSTTGRGGAANQGGASTPRGGAATNGGSGNRAGNAGNVGRAGSSNGNKAGNAGIGGSGATAGAVGKGGSAGTVGDGGTSAITGHAGNSSSSTSSANAGSSGASNPATGGASTGGAATGGTSSVAGSAGAAGGPAVVMTCNDGCANVNIPFSAAGQKAEFSAGLAVDLIGNSTMSITVYAPGAIDGDQIQVTLENTSQKCTFGARSLLPAASGYLTLSYSNAVCPPMNGVDRAVVTVTSGDAGDQNLSIEAISITATTSGTVTWGFDTADRISTSAGNCGASSLCAVSGAVTGALTWTPPDN